MIERPSDDQILRLCESGNNEGALDWFRQQVDHPTTGLFFFLKVVLGYPDLTHGFHGPMCAFIQDDSYSRRGLLCPRKYLKSTCVKGYVLRKLTKDTNQRFLFVGENDKVGGKNLTDVKWHIRENTLFQALYPHMIPPDYGRNWSESSILLPRTKTFDEPTIDTVGIGAKGTGFHYNGIIYDDPIGLIAAQSQAEMQRAIDWFAAAEGLHDSPATWELVVGTRWRHGKGDLYGWIMAEMPHRVLKTKEDGYKWFIQNSGYYAGKPTWPERYPLEVLEKMRKRMRTYLFNANIENNPSAGEGSELKPIHTYTIDQDDRRYLVLEDGEKVLLSNLLRISIYDPSSGGTQAEAENAIVIAGMDWKHRVFFLDAWSKNCGFGRAIEEWHVLNDKWRCAYNYFESVGAHKEVDEMLRMRPARCQFCGKDHRKIRPKPIQPPPGNKEDRIRDYMQPACEEDRIYVGEHLRELKRQLEEFPFCDLLDLADCAAYAVKRLRPPAGSKEDASKKKVEPVNRGAPRTHTAFDHGGY